MAIATAALAVLAVPSVASALEPVLEAGFPGSGNGQLNQPEALAVDSDGHVWVADTGNNRVQEFGPEGEYLSQFGEPGSGNGQLNEPNGIAIDPEGDVWVADAGNKRVQEFNYKGEYLAQYELWNERPSGFDVESQKTFWTGLIDAGCVGKWETQKWNEYSFAELLGTECEIESPRGIAVGSGGNAWVTDSAAERVVKLGPNTGKLSEFGEPGSGNGQLNEPAGIMVGFDGNLWVADSGNQRVQVFFPEGEYIFQFGVEGGLQDPIDIAADPQDALWVLDKATGSAQKWSYDWESPAVTSKLMDQNGDRLPAGTPFSLRSTHSVWWNTSIAGTVICENAEMDAEVLLNAEAVAEAEGSGEMQGCFAEQTHTPFTGVEMTNLRLEGGGVGTMDLAADFHLPFGAVCHYEGKLDVTYMPGDSKFRVEGEMTEVSPGACGEAEFGGYFSLETVNGEPKPITIS